MNEHRFTYSAHGDRSLAGSNRGFTLIEMVLVIVIIGILAAVVMLSGRQMFDTARVEETKQEMDALAYAAVGNDQIVNNGVRSDFGYVGDVGALPPDLDALVTKPGGYATWKGPYLTNRFSQVAADFRTDAWGAGYGYAGVTITSTGSGSSITRRLAPSADALLRNEVQGTVLDLDGTPPGPLHRDSVSLVLTFPNGLGGMSTRSSNPDDGGYFRFDSVPIGVHPLQMVYEPDNDTLNYFVVVTPGSTPYALYILTTDVWYATDELPGLIGQYTLDEGSGQTAHDASGLAPDAALQNDPAGAGWSAGRINGAFTFDGNNDYFETPASDDELQITDDYTLSVWIFARSTQVTWAGIICRCTVSGDDNLWTLQWDDNSGTTKRITIYHPGGANWRSTYTLAEAQGAWHHIAVTYRLSPPRVQLFVDGAFHSESTSLTTGPGTGMGKLRIGCDRADYTWNGLIDDVRIYNRVLSPEEIQSLYGLAH